MTSTLDCDCYKKRYLPTILALEGVIDNMPFALSDYDGYQQKIHDVIVHMNTNVKCINRCYFDGQRLPNGFGA